MLAAASDRRIQSLVDPGRARAASVKRASCLRRYFPDHLQRSGRWIEARAGRDLLNPGFGRCSPRSVWPRPAPCGAGCSAGSGRSRNTRRRSGSAWRPGSRSSRRARRSATASESCGTGGRRQTRFIAVDAREGTGSGMPPCDRRQDGPGFASHEGNAAFPASTVRLLSDVTRKPVLQSLRGACKNWLGRDSPKRRE